MLLLFLSMIDNPEDERKFEQLYLLYYEIMMRTANKILRDEYLAEDAVHETFSRILNDLEKIDDVSCHQTRSYTVIKVRGIALNMLRERRKVIDMPFEELVEDVEAGDLEDEIADEISYEELRAALGRLPLIHRDALYLMYYDDLPVRKIAGQLGLSESAAKKRLERARGALRAELTKKGVVAE